MILATVSADPDFHKDVRASLDGHLDLRPLGTWATRTPPGCEASAPEHKCILIVDFGDAARALPVARAVDGRPQIAIIAVKGGGSRDELLQLMQAGVREVLANFTDRATSGRRPRAPLPRWPCAGEILARNYTLSCPPSRAAAQPRWPPTPPPWRRNWVAEPTLLLDFDIRLGVTSFLLKAEGAHTIVDALLQSDRLDLDLWSSLVSQIKNLHLLGLGSHGFFAPGLHRALHGAAGFRHAPLFAGRGRSAGHHGGFRNARRCCAPSASIWCARPISARCTWRAAKPPGCRIFG